MSNLQFTKATRKKSKLRCLIGGPSGGGKTYGALLIAKGIGGRIGFIDTERGSASSYSDLADFDVLELAPPYSPERYIEAIHAAEAGGFDVLVIDSLTHVWEGSGGCLEINEQLAASKYKGNTWSAWSDTTPRYRALLDAILQSPMHILCTSRMKTETAVGDDKKVRKIGMKNELRAGTEYEFGVVFELEHEKHLALATKDRTELFTQPHVLCEETGRRLLAWLESGAEPVKAEPAPEHLERDRYVAAFKIALIADVGEEAKADGVFGVHSALREVGTDLYELVWQYLPANERAAIKTYIEQHRKAMAEVVPANGRAMGAN
jgi:hypothetical protein